MPDVLPARRISWDPDAELESAFRQHSAALASYAYRIVRSPDLARDVVQDVFLAVWRRPGGPRPEHVVPEYLYTAVRNGALKRVQRAKVEQRWQVSQDVPQDVPAVDAAVDATDLTRAAHEAISRLPERCRAVFLLSRERGLTYPEIAATLGISVKTVETQMGRAIKALRIALAPYV